MHTFSPILFIHRMECKGCTQEPNLKHISRVQAQRSVGPIIQPKHFQALGKNTIEMMPLVFSISWRFGLIIRAKPYLLSRPKTEHQVIKWQK